MVQLASISQSTTASSDLISDCGVCPHDDFVTRNPRVPPSVQRTPPLPRPGYERFMSSCSKNHRFWDLGLAPVDLTRTSTLEWMTVEPESPLLEQDLSEPGVLEPSQVYAHTDAPIAAVMCFFQEVVQEADGQVQGSLSVYGGRPIYETTRNGERVAYFFPGLGAPAAAATMEEAIAMGCRDFIAVGGAGALTADLDLGHVMVVEAALRDEGTSHHYLPPSRFVEADPEVTQSIEDALIAAGWPLFRGRSWTTDAIFRETPSRMSRRVAEGCSMVEMEAAAFFAVGQHRGVRVGQPLYAGDTLAGEAWDSRDWTSMSQVRTALFEIALDAASQIPNASSRRTPVGAFDAAAEVQSMDFDVVINSRINTAEGAVSNGCRPARGLADRDGTSR